MENFTLKGGSATDFRPVFAYVDKLRAEGAFTALRGLLYFTDGMGIYPKKRPPYDTAFLLLEEPPLSMQPPPWCIRLRLDAQTVHRAQAEDWDEEAEELPEL